MTYSPVIVALLAGVGCGATLAAESDLLDAEPDAELLEFLGSWEGEEEEWQDFFDNLPAVLDDTTPLDERENPEEPNTGGDEQ